MFFLLTGNLTLFPKPRDVFESRNSTQATAETTKNGEIHRQIEQPRVNHNVSLPQDSWAPKCLALLFKQQRDKPSYYLGAGVNHRRQYSPEIRKPWLGRKANKEVADWFQNKNSKSNSSTNAKSGSRRTLCINCLLPYLDLKKSEVKTRNKADRVDDYNKPSNKKE